MNITIQEILVVLSGIKAIINRKTNVSNSTWEVEFVPEGGTAIFGDPKVCMEGLRHALIVSAAEITLLTDGSVTVKKTNIFFSDERQGLPLPGDDSENS